MANENVHYMPSRRVLILLFIASVSGCTVTKPSPEASAPSAAAATRSTAKVSDQCASNRRKCIYEGAYESGEKNYAEQEAKRLNLAELARLRRSFGK